MIIGAILKFLGGSQIFRENYLSVLIVTGRIFFGRKTCRFHHLRISLGNSGCVGCVTASDGADSD